MVADRPLLGIPLPPLPCWQARLPDSSEVLIRPMLPEDHALEAEFLASLPAREAEHVRVRNGLEDVQGIAFLAVSSADQERVLGVAHCRGKPGHAECDCEVSVAQGWQERGLDSLLMRQLESVARAHGFAPPVRAALGLGAADPTQYVRGLNRGEGRR